MNDLISRSALLHVVRQCKEAVSTCANHDYMVGYASALSGVEGQIATTPAVAAAPQWVSVQDRLPEPYHTYLVVIKEKYSWETAWDCAVDVADMVDGDGYIDDMWNTFNDWKEGQEVHVTHWMPLPEPPKMDGDMDALD